MRNLLTATLLTLALTFFTAYSLIKTSVGIEKKSRRTDRMVKYTVRPGETISEIAERIFGSYKKLRDIAQANNIKSPYRIRAGQSLVIPYIKLARDFQSGIASWYGDYFHGRETSSGEYFDMYGYTAAHRSLPLGTLAMVSNLENSRHVIVRINDRGPYIDGRIIDLSYEAARAIEMAEDGVTKVKVQIISTPEQIAKLEAGK